MISRNISYVKNVTRQLKYMSNVSPQKLISREKLFDKIIKTSFCAVQKEANQL